MEDIQRECNDKTITTKEDLITEVSLAVGVTDPGHCDIKESVDVRIFEVCRDVRYRKTLYLVYCGSVCES